MSKAFPAVASLVLLAGCLAPAAPLDPAAAPGALLACVAPCKAPIDANPGGGWEPHVAVHPLDPMHVVVATRAMGSGGTPASFTLWFDLHVSIDGGRTWNVTPVRETEPFGSSADAPNVVGDPVLAFLPDGTLLLAGATLHLVPAGFGGVIRDVRLFVARSPDGGFTVEDPVVVYRSQGLFAVMQMPPPFPTLEAGVLSDLPDKPWIATGPDGTALLTWTRFLVHHPDSPTEQRGEITLSASRDGGRTWSAPTAVARGSYWLQGSSPVVGSDGAWAVAYADMAARQAHVAVSRDDGATWRDAVVAPEAWMPSLGVARLPGGDRLLLANAAPEGDGDRDAVPQAPTLSWSDDGGATWTAPLALDAPEAPGRVLPAVAADADGVVYVTFAHALGGDASRFHAVALRPGEWRADLVLDDAIAGPTTALGDYLGLSAGASGAFAVWATTADGREYDVVGSGLAAT